LRADPDDRATHVAYADLLNDQGNPRGEFIEVQLPLEDASCSLAERKWRRQRERELFQSHGRTWLGDLARYLLDQEGVREWSRGMGLGYRFQFARGWLAGLHLEESSVPFARALRRCPLAGLLRELAIDRCSRDAPGGVRAFFDALAGCGRLKNVRRFQLGLEGDEEGSYTDGAFVAGLVREMPRLEELRLFAQGVPSRLLFALPMSQLRVLYVYYLTEYPLEVLAANASLGQLRELSLWPHWLSPFDRVAYLTPAGVQALLGSPHLKGLTHLELHRTDLGDAGCAAIVQSGLLRRLKVLNLSDGCITDAGAGILAACPDLKNLQRLDLSNNALTDDGMAILRAAGVALTADDQFSPTDIAARTHLRGRGDW
jgi:uncharacterized protein (TIGR02996 family)